MKYSDYLTFADPKKRPNNVYDIFINDEKVKRVETYFMYQFFNFINTKSISTVFDFLDFHFNRYTETNPGKEKMFLLFVKECISGTGIVETGNGEKLKMYQPIHEGRKETVKEWIEQKKKELITKTETGTGKSYISHPQQVLLFHELGIIKFLIDKYKLGKEQTAEIISLLANRGKDNTGDYIRYIEQPKEKTAKSKQNMNPKTPDNIEFVREIINKITPPV